VLVLVRPRPPGTIELKAPHSALRCNPARGPLIFPAKSDGRIYLLSSAESEHSAEFPKIPRCQSQTAVAQKIQKVVAGPFDPLSAVQKSAIQGFSNRRQMLNLASRNLAESVGYVGGPQGFTVFVAVTLGKDRGRFRLAWRSSPDRRPHGGAARYWDRRQYIAACTGTLAMMTFRSGFEVDGRFELVAEAILLGKSLLAAEVIREFADNKEWRIAEIAAALKDTDAGGFASEQEVTTLGEKWKLLVRQVAAQRLAQPQRRRPLHRGQSPTTSGNATGRRTRARGLAQIGDRSLEC
jgi:RHH-type transcriptional regulator, rel operon repressor / antitoxin RelB